MSQDNLLVGIDSHFFFVYEYTEKKIRRRPPLILTPIVVVSDVALKYLVGFPQSPGTYPSINDEDYNDLDINQALTGSAN